MRKTIVLSLVAALLFSPPASVFASDENGSTVKWHDVATAFYSDDEPENYGGFDNGSQTIRIGKTNSGGDNFAFVRSPLGGDFFAGEIIGAKLFLKTVRGKSPGKLRMGMVSGYWSRTAATNCEKAKSLVDFANLAVTEVRHEAGGWVSVDITEMLKTWLRGDARNAGLALFGMDGEEHGTFVSGETLQKTEAPYIEVTGKIGSRPSGYGKFEYSRQPTEGSIYPGGGNCLAYALRDNIPVAGENLGIRNEEVNRIYQKSGEDGVAEYISALFEEYVEKYRGELCISNFRRIDDFNSAIDPALEYRVALRVGCDPDHPMSLGSRNYDFHFWAQIGDGRWAQKFSGAQSQIVPHSASLSPGEYAWDIGDQWLTQNSYGFYSSKVVYYAVAKNTNEFTEHRKSPFEDTDIYIWLHGGVDYAFSNGLMSAVSTKPMLFGPDLPLTRGMAAEALYKYHMKNGSFGDDAGLSAESGLFSDVPEGTEYYLPAKWAAENGIAAGYGNGAFGPGDTITREQLAAMFLNYERFSGNIPPDGHYLAAEFEFSDAGKISGWAREAAKKLVRQGILRADGDLFEPKKAMTRVEFAEMLWLFNYFLQL
ncbi:MAG: S-layer homology domain-containing protein [Oscillospiraceae bacterium]|nr:S-layer homology domain-containing protein [Oscillospiraceae bacterium]